MADETKEPGPAATETTPTPKKSDQRPAKAEAPPAAKATKPKKSETKPAPRRPTLDPEAARLLRVRNEVTERRPKFVRTASHRYFRIGRWESWRRPRGLQSKQRRHYGYRPNIVRIGYGSPKATRGLTPSGFRPVLVRTEDQIAAIDAARDAVIIARTVGTRRRLALEEACRRRGLHILNPIVKEREET
jgi:large subunit ribosomal protein L32e